MMKKLLLISLCVALASCASMSLEKSIRSVDLGMSKQQVVKILGGNYTVDVKVRVPEGDMEVLRYTSVYNREYLVKFLNGRVVEVFKYGPPTESDNYPVHRGDRHDHRQ